ncbi:MAG: SDR family oxidoreductase [Actinobacteria bacterium]|nr:SDR family oxidoreductase [Actinomycetota bacterium]
MDERVAVVTGAGRGMGRAVVHAFAARGVRVVAASRTLAELEETAAAAGGEVRPFACDAADPAQVAALFEFAVAELGGVDVLVCCHGVYLGGSPALELPLAQFDRTLAINTRSILDCAQHAGRAMRAAGRGGRMVFISSMNGQAAQTLALDYDVSKAAVDALARGLAVELAPDKITVNSIAPGWIRTEMSAEELVELEGKGLVMNPLGEVGTPEQVALATLWLTDPANGFTTGTVITIDGGQTAMLPLPWDPTDVTAPGSLG